MYLLVCFLFSCFYCLISDQSDVATLIAMHEPELTFLSFCFVWNRCVSFRFVFQFMIITYTKPRRHLFGIYFYDLPVSDDLVQPHEEQEKPSRTLV